MTKTQAKMKSLTNPMNMNSSETAFRLAKPGDRKRILSVQHDAFGEEGEIIFSLVAEMLDDPTAEPIHSFVAEHGDAIVAHVLFTLTQLESQGVALVFVLGYPDYYSRFGFAPAGVQGFDAPYPILPKNADAWMVKELQPGAIDSNEGTVRCCTALDQPQYWQE